MTDHRYLIDVDELHAQLTQPAWRVVDCRFNLMQPAQGQEEYERGHIPGASYADLDNDLAGAVSDSSGRHPLPSAGQFAATLSAWGIDNNSQVVVYDGGSGAIAARLWWMLKWLGHERVAVLNGGFAAWQEGAYEVSDLVESFTASSFQVQPNQDLIVSTADVEEATHAGNSPMLVDARDRARFAGEVEPIDSAAGHVPGAVNYPFSESVDEKGVWKGVEEIRDNWLGVLGADLDRPWVAMCGSGVTACHLALSAGLAGYRLPGLYVGSWSEWIRDPGRPIAIGSE
jgi:thiosulfate/3-mercaptopyruvate sulfurtransferase